MSAAALVLAAASCGDSAPRSVSATSSPSPSPSPSPTLVAPSVDPNESLPPLGRAVVSFDAARVEVEIADDYYERRRGLMFRDELGSDAGMLFIFPARSQGGFWMKNTLIPLQIAYMERTAPDRYQIVDIEDMTPCEADPCPLYKPDTPYDVALEVNEGWFDDNGVEVGAEAVVEAK